MKKRTAVFLFCLAVLTGPALIQTALAAIIKNMASGLIVLHLSGGREVQLHPGESAEIQASDLANPEVMRALQRGEVQVVTGVSPGPKETKHKIKRPANREPGK